jgi:signal transduction histidine kinase
MHDGLAQVLGYVNVKAGAARRLVGQGKVTEAAHELEQLELAAREVYADVRESILGLRTVTAGQSGLMDVLREYLERFSEQSNIKVDLVMQCDETALHLGPEAEVQVIRIIQEALSNVRKHSGAKSAWIRLDQDPDSTILVVEDNGQGFSLRRTPLAGGPRFGLQTMRERAEALDGSFALDTKPGSGTKVVVRIPIQRSEEE